MIPEHYTKTIEPVQRVSREEAAAFFKVSAIKYLSRAGIKQGVAFEDDWNKGVYCIKRWLELQGKKEQPEPAPETEPVYRPLGTHSIPDGYRQLADEEVIQKGDVFYQMGWEPGGEWVASHARIGYKVKEVLSDHIYARPCSSTVSTPPSTAPNP